MYPSGGGESWKTQTESNFSKKVQLCYVLISWSTSVLLLRWSGCFDSLKGLFQLSALEHVGAHAGSVTLTTIKTLRAHSDVASCCELKLHGSLQKYLLRDTPELWEARATDNRN